jgi:hypothetical protein
MMCLLQILKAKEQRDAFARKQAQHRAEYERQCNIWDRKIARATDADVKEALGRQMDEYMENWKPLEEEQLGYSGDPVGQHPSLMNDYIQGNKL